MTALPRHRTATAAAFLLGSVVGLHNVPVAAQSPRIPPSDVTRPTGTTAFVAPVDKLGAIGTARHGDTSLSPQGLSCNSCHAEADSYNATFKKPWPHFVESVKTKTGLDAITAEGMVQFCMISAMGGRPLAWDSEALAGLTAFVLERHEKVVER